MYAYASKKGNVPLSFRQVERFRKKHFFPFLVTHIFHFWYDIERLCGDHFRPSGFRQSATPRKESGSPVEGPERFFRKRSARRKDGGKKANAHYAVNVRLPMDATNHATAPRWREQSADHVIVISIQGRGSTVRPFDLLTYLIWQSQNRPKGEWSSLVAPEARELGPRSPLA